MALLCIDLETSGLIRKDLPLGDPAQPWAIRLAALHMDMQGRRLNAIDVTIKPDGRKVKADAAAVHGVDTAVAERIGVQEAPILHFLAQVAGKAHTVITFGDFDATVIESLFIGLENRLNKPPGTFRNRWVRPGLQFVDIQKPACQMACRLPPPFENADYAWPSLDAASEIILGEKPREGVHDPWDDLGRTVRLYLALKERGHFPTVTP